MARQIPEFVIRNDVNDVSTQMRIQRISNGFIVKTGIDPIFYNTIEEAAEAVRDGLIAADWDHIYLDYTPPSRKSK